jgi:hypothetical protein
VIVLDKGLPAVTDAADSQCPLHAASVTLLNQDSGPPPDLHVNRHVPFASSF